MTELAIRQVSASQRWPMTGEAWDTLLDELGRLRAEVVSLAGANPVSDGVVGFSVVKATRRFDVLTSVLDASERIHEADRAVIGRRVTVLEQDGESVTYTLVLPGYGDPGKGWISADSPLGTAVLRSAPGDVVQVVAPSGPRAVTILSVE